MNKCYKQLLSWLLVQMSNYTGNAFELDSVILSVVVNKANLNWRGTEYRDWLNSLNPTDETSYNHYMRVCCHTDLF